MSVLEKNWKTCFDMLYFEYFFKIFTVLSSGYEQSDEVNTSKIS